MENLRDLANFINDQRREDLLKLQSLVKENKGDSHEAQKIKGRIDAYTLVLHQVVLLKAHFLLTAIKEGK